MITELLAALGLAAASLWGWRRYATKCKESLDDRLGEGVFKYNSGTKYNLKEKAVVFWLYTKSTGESPLGARTMNPGQLYDGEMSPEKPVKLIIHGWNGHPDSYFTKTIRMAYLESHDYNVIIADWSTESHVLYNRDRRFVKELGIIIARFIDRLHLETSFDMDKLHIIGHSLGAHVCGVVGLNTRHKVGRITGLDPAKPMFSIDDEDRLCPASAKFVDVIHTCGKALGMYDALGHADFYPNQGTPRQPGCGISAGKRSHERSVDYFAESIHNPEAFIAFKGEAWNDFKRRRSLASVESSPMGEGASHEARGKYWLKTAGKAPYGLGESS